MQEPNPQDSPASAGPSPPVPAAGARGEEGQTAAEGRLSGRVFVLLAAVMWSSSGLFAKLTIFDDWPASERGLLLSFWRALFAGLVLVPFVRKPRFRAQLIPMTISFAGMNVTFLCAMVLTTAANAIWLQSTAPLWVFVVGVFVLGETVNRRDLLALACGILGVGIILSFELERDATPAGVALGLASGICYGGVILFMRRLRAENSAWLVALNHLVAAAAMLPLVVYLDRWPSPSQLAVLAAFGTFQMGVPYILFARGLRLITSQEASLIALLEPVLTPVGAYLARGELPAPWTLAGGPLILVGLTLRYALPRRRSAEA